jgi:hypothetical protein
MGLYDENHCSLLKSLAGSHRVVELQVSFQNSSLQMHRSSISWLPLTNQFAKARFARKLSPFSIGLSQPPPTLREPQQKLFVFFLRLVWMSVLHH